jgi:transcriptional regulator with GAF, ATPase, and Fis domain
MFELQPQDFGATFEAFLESVHPDDREFVEKAYVDSVKNRTGYDLVHRLLLKNGRIKHVYEKCKTEYDEHGNPVRSLGTVQDITERIRKKQGFSGIIGQDRRMRELFDTITELADVNMPVLIQGESGTGKELIAAAIHREGVRARKPFVPVNCSALPEGLLESELFGHVKGAFTGALRDKKGRFELAHGGTLFLDEVVDMPKFVQVKLLRVLQEGTFERVGDERTISVDVRIISASNRDLLPEVKKGNFREDLYYRLNVVPIHLPPLRERKNDIPLLVEKFLEKSAQEGLRSEGLSKEALAVMIDYPWPGNVRELQSAIKFALVKSRNQRIEPEHLPLELIKNADIQVPRNTSGKLSPENVRSALSQTVGNKSKAAKYLGVGRATLYRFLSEHPEIQ